MPAFAHREIASPVLASDLKSLSDCHLRKSDFRLRIQLPGFSSSSPRLGLVGFRCPLRLSESTLTCFAIASLSWFRSMSQLLRYTLYLSYSSWWCCAVNCLYYTSWCGLLLVGQWPVVTGPHLCCFTKKSQNHAYLSTVLPLVLLKLLSGHFSATADKTNGRVWLFLFRKCRIKLGGVAVGVRVRLQFVGT